MRRAQLHTFSCQRRVRSERPTSRPQALGLFLFETDFLVSPLRDEDGDFLVIPSSRSGSNSEIRRRKSARFETKPHIRKRQSAQSWLHSSKLRPVVLI